jgi:hypothetical protein
MVSYPVLNGASSCNVKIAASEIRFYFLLTLLLFIFLGSVPHTKLRGEVDTNAFVIDWDPACYGRLFDHRLDRVRLFRSPPVTLETGLHYGHT